MSGNKSSKLISSFSSKIDSSYKSSDKKEPDVNLNNFNLLKLKMINKRTKFDKKKNRVVIKMLESIHNNVFEDCINTIESDIKKYIIYFIELTNELKDDEDFIHLDNIEITIKKWKKELKEILSIIKQCINELFLKFYKSNKIDIIVSINYKDVHKYITLEHLYILMHNYINLCYSFEPLYIDIDEEFNLIKHKKKYLNVNTSYNLIYRHYYYSLFYNYIIKPIKDREEGIVTEEVDSEKRRENRLNILVTIFSEMIDIMIAKIFIDLIKKYRTNQTKKGIEQILSNKVNEDVAKKITQHIKKPLFNTVYK